MIHNRMRFATSNNNTTGGAASSRGFEPYLACAVAVCSPWKLHRTFSHFTSSPVAVWVYGQDFLRDLKKRVREQDILMKHPTCENTRQLFQRLMSVRTCKEWDEVIHPHFGYSSVHAYYSDSECWPWLRRIVNVPLLCITSREDPVVGPAPSEDEWREDVFAREEASLHASSPSTVCHVWLPAGGGHLGYLGSPRDEREGKPNALESFIIKALKSAFAASK